MPVDPEQPPVERKTLPLKWGFGGPIIGSVIVNDDGTAEGVITDKKYVDALKPDIPSEYSIVDLSQFQIDDRHNFLFETRADVNEKKSITIKKEVK